MPPRRFAILAIALLVLFCGYWLFGSTKRGIDPQVVEMFERDQKPLLDKMSTATGEQRGRIWEEMRSSMENLSEEQRDQVRTLMRQDFERREDERLKKFFTLTKAQQDAELDKRIDEFEQMRERFANRDRSKDGKGPGGPPGGGRGGPGGGPGGGWSGGRDPMGRQRATQSYMNRTTAETRAMRNEYAMRMDERRKERGLPEGGFGGSPGGPSRRSS